MIITPGKMFEFGSLMIPGHAFDVYLDGKKLKQIFSVDTEKLVYFSYEATTDQSNIFHEVENKVRYIGVFPDVLNPRIEMSSKQLVK